jgi:hypothetical protein
VSTPRQEGIERYVAADASDPFALARCLAHAKQGICNRRFDEKGNSTDCEYGAVASTAMRLTADGTEYPVVIYMNRVRP